MDKNGNPFDFESRSLPYVEDPANRHVYEETGNLSDIVGDIKNSGLTEERKQNLMDKLANGPKATNKENADLVRNNPNLTNAEKASIIEEMARANAKTYFGEAAPAFNQKGGAIQVQPPLSIKELCEIGTLERR